MDDLDEGDVGPRESDLEKEFDGSAVDVEGAWAPPHRLQAGAKLVAEYLTVPLKDLASGLGRALVDCTAKRRVHQRQGCRQCDTAVLDQALIPADIWTHLLDAYAALGLVLPVA